MRTNNRLLRSYLVAIALFAISCPSLSSSTYTIGLATWTGYPENVQGFKDGLQAHGIDLNKVTFISGAASTEREQQVQAAQQMIEHKVDLVYSLTTPGTLIVKQTLPNSIPIVFSIVTYPADSGLIDSFEYSGNNLVGTSNYISLNHYIKIVDSLLPSTKTAAIFHRLGEPNSKIQASNLTRLLKRKGIQVVDIEVATIEQLEQQAQLASSKVDLFITTTDTLLQNGGEEALISVANSHRIPILSSNKKGIEQGATFGPVADFYKLGQQAGKLAAQILTKGKEPRHLESSLQETPTFLINKSSFEHLNLDKVALAHFNYKWH